MKQLQLKHAHVTSAVKHAHVTSAVAAALPAEKGCRNEKTAKLDESVSEDDT